MVFQSAIIAFTSLKHFVQDKRNSFNVYGETQKECQKKPTTLKFEFDHKIKLGNVEPSELLLSAKNLFNIIYSEDLEATLAEEDLFAQYYSSAAIV
ncbi:hypothetical protein QTP88_027815 [Uroleucon formosanum]